MFVPLDSLITTLLLLLVVFSLVSWVRRRTADIVDQKDLKDLKADIRRLEGEWGNFYEQTRRMTGRLNQRETRAGRTTASGGTLRGNGEHIPPGHAIEDVFPGRAADEGEVT